MQIQSGRTVPLRVHVGVNVRLKYSGSRYCIWTRVPDLVYVGANLETEVI
jgi:hypothetical protein